MKIPFGVDSSKSGRLTREAAPLQILVEHLVIFIERHHAQWSNGNHRRVYRRLAERYASNFVRLRGKRHGKHRVFNRTHRAAAREIEHLAVDSNGCAASAVKVHYIPSSAIHHPAAKFNTVNRRALNRHLINQHIQFGLVF